MFDCTNEKYNYIIDQDSLPEAFPTHLHEAGFWEALGRVVGTFGFLEESLGKAIFSFTATKPYSELEIHHAYTEWLPKLERALNEPLDGLINSYGKAVRNHSGATITNLDDLIGNLKKASKLRNVLCHGSWRTPDNKGSSIPLFIDRQNKIFETAIDVEFLNQVQKHVAELVCAVINSVTYMGWQFPGSSGPGNVIWKSG